MVSAFCNWWAKYMTYTNIRNVAELFYFIVLTGVMAYYAKKSYQRSVEAKPDIITHIYIDYKERLQRGQSCYPLYLEIYNNGTGAAKNLKLTTDNEKLVGKFSIFDNNLGFIQPGHSKYIPIGSLMLSLSSSQLLVFDDALDREELNKTWFFLDYEGKKREKINLNFEYVLGMPRTPLGKTSEESVEEKQEKQMEAMSKSLGGIGKYLQEISRGMKR